MTIVYTVKGLAGGASSASALSHDSGTVHSTPFDVRIPDSSPWRDEHASRPP